MKATMKPVSGAQEIYKVTIKATGKQCYAVPSDSQPGTYYMTCWNEKTANWECSCQHGKIMAEYGKAASCKHTRACQTSILANKAQARRHREQEAQMVELAQEMLATEQAVRRLTREEYCQEFAIYE